MFRIKKNGFCRNDFRKELEKTLDKKAYGLRLADEALNIFYEYFRDKADCVVCYEYAGQNIFLKATLPEDEAAFYRSGFSDDTENTRLSGERAVCIRTENGALHGMWVLELHTGADESMEELYWEMVSMLQTVIAACLLAEQLEKERRTDCVTGLYGNEIFEQSLRQFVEQEAGGYLIAARHPVRHDKPYGEDGMNRQIQGLVKTCRESGIPYIYRIGEDTVALLCLEGEKKAYAAAQQIADSGETDLYVVSFSILEEGKIYSAIQCGLDRAEADGRVYGLHYEQHMLSVYVDSREGGQNAEKKP
jgi:GGDEF domain-containing protein